MLGLGLVAIFALSAMTAVPALAAKDPYNFKTFGQYKGCPYTNPEAYYCYVGRTAGGANGGYFQLGNVKVALNKPITLQGAFKEGTGELSLLPAANGFQTLEAPELKVQGSIGLITHRIQEEVGWPASLQKSFKEAQKNKETGLNVQIELAGGNLIYETVGALDTEHLLEESGPAFKLPLKVRLINPWLASLGGGPCQIGSDANPVWQDLSSEQPGRAGSFGEAFEFLTLGFKGSRLLAFNWPVPQGANGCGTGETEALVDAALNKVLELSNNNQHGITVLEGDLFTGLRSFVQEKYEKGEGE
jgi:hypothetical protein